MVSAVYQVLRPLVAPLIAAIFLAPLVALAYLIWHLLGSPSPSVDVGSLGLPGVDLPSLGSFKWLGDAFDAIADVVRWLIIPLALIAGLLKTQEARRERAANAGRDADPEPEPDEPVTR